MPRWVVGRCRTCADPKSFPRVAPAWSTRPDRFGPRLGSRWAATQTNPTPPRPRSPADGPGRHYQTNPRRCNPLAALGLRRPVPVFRRRASATERRMGGQAARATPPSITKRTRDGATRWRSWGCERLGIPGPAIGCCSSPMPSVGEFPARFRPREVRLGTAELSYQRGLPCRIVGQSAHLSGAGGSAGRAEPGGWPVVSPGSRRVRRCRVGAC